MKITVKTLQQKVFQIDAEGSETVGDLKQRIQASQGHAVESQKIIYSGKVLPDNKTIESCEIREKDFLVLMVSKPKPTPTPALAPAQTPAAASASSPAPATQQASSAPAPPSTPAAAPAATTPSTTTTSVPPSSPVAATTANQAAFGDMSTFLSGPALEVQINNMVEMGFPRDQVLRAMRASFNNPDRAVEYLMNGIPPHLLAEQSQPRAPVATPAQPAGPAAPPATPAAPAPGQAQNLFQLAQQQQQQQPGGGAPGGATGAGAGLDIGALRDNPQMAQLRGLVQQNPALLQPLVQQLAASNPGLAQAFAQNPEMLMQLLSPGEEDILEGGEGGGGQPIVVNITEEERAAIERLEALGFPRQAVIEAYFACDKNEELAANYLFESGYDD